MSREEALEYIFAYAVCNIEGATCLQCPMWTGRGKESCEAWTPDDVFEAIKEISLSGGI